VFRPRRRGDGDKYCSRECAFKDVRAWRGKTRSRVSKPKDTPRKRVLRERDAYRRWSAASRSPCRVCRELFVRRDGVGERHCSQECADRSNGDAITRHSATRDCVECGIAFSALYPYRANRFCTDSCRSIVEQRVKRQNKSRYRTIRRCREEHNGPFHQVDPFVVFTRDQWCCRYCGCDTPRKLRGTYEGNAPELDHVVPLARGGPTYIQQLRYCMQRLQHTKRIDDRK
jgi:hypothetical protein